MTQQRFHLEPPAVVDALRDRAIRQVAQHAEDYVPDFSAMAQHLIRYYLKDHGPTSGEELTLMCKREGCIPHDDRAFGSVFKAMARRGVIEKVGTARRERGHGTSGGNVWALTGR